MVLPYRSYDMTKRFQFPGKDSSSAGKSPPGRMQKIQYSLRNTAPRNGSNSSRSMTKTQQRTRGGFNLPPAYDPYAFLKGEERDNSSEEVPLLDRVSSTSTKKSPVNVEQNTGTFFKTMEKGKKMKVSPLMEKAASLAPLQIIDHDISENKEEDSLSCFRLISALRGNRKAKLIRDNEKETIEEHHGSVSRRCPTLTCLKNTFTGWMSKIRFRNPFSSEEHQSSTIPDIEAAETTESEASTEDLETVMIEGESVDTLKSSPRILSVEMMQQIFDKGLPPTIKLMTWRRVYSLERDGDSFETMLRKVRGLRHTLIVIETTKGEILGGFADAPWEDQGVKNRSFHGTGSTFLFNVEKSQCENKVKIHKWTGKNSYSQVLDAGKGELAMGGGGEFGLIVQDFFSRGSTGSCETFGNPPLTKDGVFNVLDLEVYGFVSGYFG